MSHKAKPALLAGLAVFGAIAMAPAARAQAVGYDTSLRSIGPATINQATFDTRTRSPIQSIGASGLDNRAAMVPAVYDPAQGRFVSALGTTRGAIAVGSTSVVSVIMTQQSGIFVAGPSSSASSGVPVRSESATSQSASVATPQIIATPGGNR
jgi:hypothetical protein